MGRRNPVLSVERGRLRTRRQNRRRLLGTRGQSEHPGAEALGDLDQEEAHPAGRRVDEHGFAGLDRVAVAGEVLSGETLQQECGGGLERDVVRQRDQLLERHRDPLGVREGAVRETHSVTDPERRSDP